MKIIFLIVLAFLFMFHHFPHASPSKGSTARQIFLGSNDKYYFTLAIISANPGSHYERYDSTFIYKIGIKENRIIERTLMTAAHYQNLTAEKGGWKRTALIQNSSIDLNEYMIENDLHFSLQSGSSVFSEDEIFIDQNGLYLVKDKEKVIKLLAPGDFLDISGITALNEVQFTKVYTCHASNLLYPQSQPYFFLKFSHIESDGYKKEFFIPLLIKVVRERLEKYGQK